MASDDRDLARKMFNNSQDVYFTFEKNENDNMYGCPICKSAMRDLAILSLCNHSIITYGKFSFWSSYLKPFLDKSITIFPEGYSEHPHPLSMLSKYMPVWKGISDPCFSGNEFNEVSISSRCTENATQFEIN